jgi:hypothetical protein
LSQLSGFDGTEEPGPRAHVDDQPWRSSCRSDLLKNGETGTERNGAMPKHQQFSTFERYVKDRKRKIKRILSDIEKRGAAAALERCRILVDHINRDFRNKKLRHLVNDISSLAEFQVAIERAASALDGIAARKKNGAGRAERGSTRGHYPGKFSRGVRVRPSERQVGSSNALNPAASPLR